MAKSKNHTAHNQSKSPLEDSALRTSVFRNARGNLHGCYWSPLALNPEERVEWGVELLRLLWLV